MSSKHPVAPMSVSSSETPFTLSASRASAAGKPVISSKKGATKTSAASGKKAVHKKTGVLSASTAAKSPVATKPASTSVANKSRPKKNKVVGSTAAPVAKKQKVATTASSKHTVKEDAPKKKRKKTEPSAVVDDAALSRRLFESSPKLVAADITQKDIDQLAPLDIGPSSIPVDQVSASTEKSSLPSDVTHHTVTTTVSVSKSQETPSVAAATFEPIAKPPKLDTGSSTSTLATKKATLVAKQTDNAGLLRVKKFAAKVKAVARNVHRTLVLPGSLISAVKKEPVVPGSLVSAQKKEAVLPSKLAMDSKPVALNPLAKKRAGSKDAIAAEKATANAALVEAIRCVFLAHQPMGISDPRIVLEDDVLQKLATQQTDTLQKLFASLLAYLMSTGSSDDTHDDHDRFDITRVTKAIEYLQTD